MLNNYKSRVKSFRKRRTSYRNVDRNVFIKLILPYNKCWTNEPTIESRNINNELNSSSHEGAENRNNRNNNNNHPLVKPINPRVESSFSQRYFTRSIYPIATSTNKSRKSATLI